MFGTLPGNTSEHPHGSSKPIWKLLLLEESSHMVVGLLVLHICQSDFIFVPSLFDWD